MESNIIYYKIQNYTLVNKKIMWFAIYVSWNYYKNETVITECMILINVLRNN